MEEAVLDGLVLVEARLCNLVPAGGIEAEGFSEAALAVCARGAVDSRGSSSSGADEGVGEGLVLVGGRGRGGGGDGEVCTFEVCCSKGGEVVTDRGGDLGEGFLDLGGVVVGF